MEEQDSILEDIKADEVEASFGQKWLTNFTDGIIEVAIIVVIYLILSKELVAKLFALTSIARYLIAIILIFSYRLTCILLMGKTIGMIICKLKYLDNNLQPLSQRERLIAVFVAKQFGIKYYKA